MRRVLYTLIASALVVALIPATALGRSHHRRHHHHARVHHKQFGRSDAPATPSMADNAGTVASFDGTKLTIQLNDGSTVSGTVNGDTEIECEAADMSQSNFNSDDEGGDHNSGDDNNDQGDDNDDNEMQNCDASSLTPGTTVHEAELKLSGAGAVWDKVELLTSSSSSSSSDDDD
ncbi:MAG TPA: hypothetical protein VFI54_15015 [Solirubrobacteraceae bacterium]|nr:hypothetical protein [Solirubrobacteraceae bacterium]